MAELKTNVMRLLDQKKISYTAHGYPHGKEAVDGLTVARLLGMDPAVIFKTLVTQGASRQSYVFVIPVLCELDLKKAAKSVKEKAVTLLAVSQLLPLTGYVRGGCSPIGMKKLFPTVLDESALACPTILVSAGKIGSQIELSPADLVSLLHGRIADVTKPSGSSEPIKKEHLS